MSEQDEDSEFVINPDADGIPTPEEPLSPRHRKLAELLASGARNKDIQEILGYSASRTSILRNSPEIQAEVKRIMDRTFEAGVSTRLKRLAEPALNIIEQVMNDRTNRVSLKEKADVAKWMLEKVDGKAIQKHEVSGGVLLSVMDKLDSMKTAGQVIDVTKSFAALPAAQPERELTPEEKEEIDLLQKWKDGF